jgi:chromate transport protein ChrA
MNLIDESEDKSLPYVATIIVAVVIGLVGIYLRFADFRYSSEIADGIMGIATIIVFTSVFKWMKK